MRCLMTSQLSETKAPSIRPFENQILNFYLFCEVFMFFSVIKIISSSKMLNLSVVFVLNITCAKFKVCISVNEWY